MEKETVATLPKSAVSHATGLVGAAGLVVALYFMMGSEINAAIAALIAMAAVSLPMLAWSILVEKVHRNESTGLDFSNPRPRSDTLKTTRVKLIGLLGTWLLLGLGYFVIRHYHTDLFPIYGTILQRLLPTFIILSLVYIYLVDRHMREPKDDLWHAGMWFLGRWGAADMEEVKDHFRGWVIKAFFLSFMLMIMPKLMHIVINRPLFNLLESPAIFASISIPIILMFDVCFGAIGYIFAFRISDSHLRSANPYLAGWVAALICYPPFAQAVMGSTMDYKVGTHEWHHWMAGYDPLLIFWAGLIIVLTVLYAWSTVVFGLRFSNLTHRGILTHGPYRWSKHPAYLSKNSFWWLIHLPFLTDAGTAEAVRNTILLLGVNGIYYWRAKTEEKHLMADPTYQAYAAWVNKHGFFASLERKLGWD